VALATLLVRQAPATGRAAAPRPVTDHRWRHAGAAFRPDF